MVSNFNCIHNTVRAYVTLQPARMESWILEFFKKERGKDEFLKSNTQNLKNPVMTLVHSI